MNMTQKKTSRLRTAIAAVAAAGLIAAQMPHAAAESIHDNPLYTAMGILVDRGQEPSAAVHAAPLALVKTAGKWGAVSTTGTAVIAAEYDEIRPYAEGYLLVRQGKKWGVFRADGKQVVPAAYRHIEELTEDRIVVQDMDKKWGCYGTDGTLILPVTQRDVVPYHDGAALVQGTDKRWSFYRADGSRLTEKTYAYVGIFSEGLASVMEDKKRVGFIDKTGAEVIAPQYASASIFSEGLAAVEVGGKWGFIDRTGTMVIAPQYREIPMGFSEGLAAVRGKKGLAYIDKTGTQVFAAPYDSALPFHDGLAEVRRKVKSTNFLGAVLTIAAGTAGQFIYDPLMLDDENVKRGYIDKTGTMIISIKNDYNSTFVDGTALVKVKSRWGCVDRTGAYLVPADYRMMRRFSEDLAAVQDTAELWGYAAKDGSVAIAPTYNAVQDFHEGLAAVVKGGKPFFIDKTGRVPFLTPSTVTELGSFAAGLAPAKVGDKWGYIDHSGSMVIAPQYEDASMFLVGQTKK